VIPTILEDVNVEYEDEKNVVSLKLEIPDEESLN